jgi:phosphoribosylformylglycinamidine cyclo-ligase
MMCWVNIMHFKESYDNNLAEEVVYIGKHKLTDACEQLPGISIGQLLLSPTRTYAPVLVQLLKTHFDKIHGLIHCSGGGQTKCLKYLPGNMRVVKDNLFTPPPIFNIIAKNSGSAPREMYEVFNMGCRMEIYCPAADATVMMEAAKQFGIDARVIGRVEESNTKELLIQVNGEELRY